MRRDQDREPDPEMYTEHDLPLLTRDQRERATEDTFRRINDEDRYRFEPWEVTLP